MMDGRSSSCLLSSALHALLTFFFAIHSSCLSIIVMGFFGPSFFEGKSWSSFAFALVSIASSSEKLETFPGPLAERLRRAKVGLMKETNEATS